MRSRRFDVRRRGERPSATCKPGLTPVPPSLSKRTVSWELCLFAAILAAVSASAGADPAQLEVDIRPAWNGFVVPGKATELGVRLTARGDAHASVRLRAPGVDSRARVTLPAGKPQLLRLPLRAPLSGRKVSIEIGLQGHSETRIEEWAPALIADEPLVVTTTDHAWQIRTETASQRTAVRYVSDRDLPHTPQAYDTVDALIVDQAGLARLDGERLSAMFGFLGGCGRLIAVGMTDEVVARLRTAAGCNGEFFVAIQHPEALYGVVDRALSMEPAPLPSAARLRSLLDHDEVRTVVLTVAVFLAAYVSLLVLAAQAAFPAWMVLAFPLGASLLAPLIWLHRGPDIVSIGWMEMYNDDRVARTATLVQLHGNGRGTGQFSLPVAHGLPLPPLPSSPRPPTFELKDQALSVQLPVRLLAREEFLFLGSTELVAPVRITVAPEGVRVHNAGGRATGRGTLFWSGELFYLPTLAPGAHWSTAGASPRRPANPLERWLAAQTRGGAASVFLRLPRAAGEHQNTPAHDGPPWLLVRALATRSSDAGSKT